MPTIFDIAEEFNIQVRKLRKMQKKGYLRCEGNGDPVADDIRVMLTSGQHPSVKQLIALIETPSLVLELGPKQQEAREHIAVLGKPEPAPDDLWPELAGAAANDKESTARLVQWAKDTMPPDKPVSHHWLAVRLILAVPDALRKYEYARLNRVFLNMRRHPDFAGWFTVKQQGPRRVTWYHRPKGFDL